MYKYTLEGLLNQRSGEYLAVATFGGQSSETTFSYKFVTTDSDGWIPFAARAGSKTFDIKYKMPYFELGQVLVDIEAQSMQIIINRDQSGRDSNLSIKYPLDLFPFNITRIIHGDTHAVYWIERTSTEEILTMQVSVSNNLPTEIRVFGEGPRPPYPEQTINPDRGLAVTGLLLKDIQGSEITDCTNCESTMLMLTAVIRNDLERTGSFVAYLELRNAEGLAVFNGLSIGTLNPNETSEIALSWTPGVSGEYELRAFVTDNSGNLE